MKRGLLGLMALLLASCASPVSDIPMGTDSQNEAERTKQKRMLVRDQYERLRTLHDVAYRIYSANSFLCNDRVRNSYGFMPLSSAWLVEEARPLWREELGVDEQVRAFMVYERGTGHRAGLRVGDHILDVKNEKGTWLNIREISSRGLFGATSFRMLEELDKQVRIMEETGLPLEMRVKRHGETLNLTIEPEEVCDYAVNYVHEDIVNAAADGDAIHIYKGIMDFTENVDELALVVGHELAHNSMGHIEAGKANRGVGMLAGAALDVILNGMGVDTHGGAMKLGLELGHNAYSVRFEHEADYVGLYMMERAGYNARDVADLWRRMAIEDPHSIEHNSSHPKQPERFVVLENTYMEIVGKRARGEPLIPNLKQ